MKPSVSLPQSEGIPVDPRVECQRAPTRPTLDFVPQLTYQAAKEVLLTSLHNNREFVPETCRERGENSRILTDVLANVVTRQRSLRENRRNPLSLVIRSAQESRIAKEWYDAAVKTSLRVEVREKRSNLNLSLTLA
ncbi:hypothetical protein AURDEDRAFT_166042 [Auricularia subglabra TFB-10046 SS5]|nr:hypothetical protein AURDEDRAFT_166042 [Auricularia subglabra TFB-10046 SS5]